MDDEGNSKLKEVKRVSDLTDDPEFMSRVERILDRKDNSSYVNRWEVTWERICEIEPRLIRLKEQVDRVADNATATFCANGWWFKIFKPQMVKLVGRNAEKTSPVLNSSYAYDIAHRMLYDDGLPACSHDGECSLNYSGGISPSQVERVID